MLPAMICCDARMVASIAGWRYVFFIVHFVFIGLLNDEFLSVADIYTLFSRVVYADAAQGVDGVVAFCALCFDGVDVRSLVVKYDSEACFC